MKKILSILFFAPSLMYAGHCACLTQSDRIGANYEAYRQLVEEYQIQSGLDVQQYYYILGKRDAYKNCLDILEEDGN